MARLAFRFVYLFSPFLLALFFVSPSLSASSTSNWGYGDNDGPSTWGKNYPKCSGENQSPINIVPSKTERSTKYSNLNFSSRGAIQTMLSNTGSSLKATLNEDSQMTLTGGPLLKRTFRVAQFHLHFAVNGKKGSEHQVKGRQTAAELHIVTYDQTHESLAGAVDQVGGLAVIGVMLERAESNVTSTPADLTKFLNESAKLKFKTNTKALQVNLTTLLPSDWASSFYFYNGSLTTPGCNAVVNWLLCRSTIKVSPYLIDALSGVYTGADDSSPSMSGNFRPPQPIGSRTVYYTGRAMTAKGAAAKASTGFLPYSALAFVMVIIALLR